MKSVCLVFALIVGVLGLTTGCKCGSCGECNGCHEKKVETHHVEKHSDCD